MMEKTIMYMCFILCFIYVAKTEKTKSYVVYGAKNPDK
jgi:hypothetical protein